jgi:hypothetical protein
MAGSSGMSTVTNPRKDVLARITDDAAPAAKPIVILTKKASRH